MQLQTFGCSLQGFTPVLSAVSLADSVICVRSFQETGLVYVGNIARETAA